MDDGELAVFADALARITEARNGESLDTALGELGWPDALALEPRAAISVLFELQGRTLATSGALDLVLLGELEQGSDAELGVVLPPLDSLGPPGTVAGTGLRVCGLGSEALSRRARALVVAGPAEQPLVAVVETCELRLRPVGGLDPAMGLVEVTGEVARAGAVAGSPDVWASAVRVGQLALAHELSGASRTMLELTTNHARQRVQFGRPIAAFQAVRHRLADGLVALESAEAALAAAWDGRTPDEAALAKAVAGRSARSVARHCQQVLAGIGFTTEHPFHRYLRRTLLLDELLGGSRSLTRRLGAQLVTTRELPAPSPL